MTSEPPGSIPHRKAHSPGELAAEGPDVWVTPVPGSDAGPHLVPSSPGRPTKGSSSQTISWGEFANREPELARFGAGRLTAAPAYLATVRRSGGPRVHPVTPIFTAVGLFLFMEPTSPKARDLWERGWFALHNGVPDNAGSGGEFNISGRGFAVDDPEMWSLVAEAATYTPEDRYVLFEFQVSEARCHGYGDVPLPSTRRWSIDQ